MATASKAPRESLAPKALGAAATQMLMHEVHHRAQVMAMLRQLGVEAQNLDYISFVVRREEYPKDKAPRA